MEIQKKESSLPYKEKSLRLVLKTKPAELLGCLPMSRAEDPEIYVLRISHRLIQAKQLLSLDMNDDGMMLLAQAILAKYEHDPFEVVELALTKGAQGSLGKTYGRLSMEVISEWMAQVLDQVAEAREQEHRNRTVAPNQSRSSGTIRLSQFLRD